MILSPLKVLELGLIENLCERELQSPEGVCLDLRVDEVYEIVGEGYLGIEPRRLPDAIANGLEVALQKGGKQKKTNRKEKGGNLCPKCSSPLTPQDGCEKCNSCGYTQCN